MQIQGHAGAGVGAHTQPYMHVPGQFLCLGAVVIARSRSHTHLNSYNRDSAARQKPLPMAAFADVSCWLG